MRNKEYLTIEEVTAERIETERAARAASTVSGSRGGISFSSPDSAHDLSDDQLAESLKEHSF